MKRSEQDRLLREILEDGEAANLRAASLAGGVDFLQRRRRRQRVLRACATGLPVFLLFLILVALLHGSSPAPPASGPLVVLRTETAKVKIITDEELFALFPNRAMALIGRPGQQQLVFLDHGAASEQP